MIACNFSPCSSPCKRHNHQGRKVTGSNKSRSREPGCPAGAPRSGKRKPDAGETALKVWEGKKIYVLHICGKERNVGSYPSGIQPASCGERALYDACRETHHRAGAVPSAPGKRPDHLSRESTTPCSWAITRSCSSGVSFLNN